MKWILMPAVVFLFFIVAACNNSGKKEEATGGTGTETPKTHVDSLFEEVMDGHNVGMAKMGKLNSMQMHLQRLLDSIGKLPAAMKKSLAPYKAGLDKAIDDLRSAQSGMNKWMEEFNTDSALSDINERIRYLSDEKLKVSRIKEEILGSLQKADSIIRIKL